MLIDKVAPLDPATIRLALFQFAQMTRAEQDGLLADSHLEVKIKVRKESLARSTQKRLSKQKAQTQHWIDLPQSWDFPMQLKGFQALSSVRF